MKNSANMAGTVKLVAGLAWRNVWRNRRRSFLTFLTIMAGCCMILFMRSFQNGSYGQMIEDGIAPLTGHIQVHENGFWKNSTLEYSFMDDPSLLAAIRNFDGVRHVSRRIHAGSLILYGDSSAGAEIIGIEPSNEKEIITLQKYILPPGRFIKDDDAKNIVLGSGIAKNLGVNTGDTVSILSQGFDGSIAADYFMVSGIFRSPNISYNSSVALIHLRQASETFSMQGYVSSYVVRIDETDETPDVRKKIQAAAGSGLEVMTWDELMPEIMQFIAMDRVSSHLFVFILYLIVAFGILNTIQMSVYERIRELGIMLSIGTRPWRVFAMVMTESFFIAVIGIVAGLLSGYALCYYFSVYPMDYSGYSTELELYGVTTFVYYAKMEAADFVSCSASIMFLALLFTFFPARRAAGLDPVRAIRHL